MGKGVPALSQEHGGGYLDLNYNAVYSNHDANSHKGGKLPSIHARQSQDFLLEEPMAGSTQFGTSMKDSNNKTKGLLRDAQNTKKSNFLD